MRYRGKITIEQRFVWRLSSWKITKLTIKLVKTQQNRPSNSWHVDIWRCCGMCSNRHRHLKEMWIYSNYIPKAKMAWHMEVINWFENNRGSPNLTESWESESKPNFKTSSTRESGDLAENSALNFIYDRNEILLKIPCCRISVVIRFLKQPLYWEIQCVQQVILLGVESGLRWHHG